MSHLLQLADTQVLSDLRVFLERLLRVGEAEVRVVTRGATVALFGCTQAPSHLTDPVPVVLVMRAFPLAYSPEPEADVTVEGRALLDRLARLSEDSLSLTLPDTVVATSWAGVLPPRGGWQAGGSIDAASLTSVAQEGMRRVAKALPENPGEALVRKVRTEVWGAKIAPETPAAVAFAAETLGFLQGEREVRVSSSLTWVRLTSSRGQVIVRRVLG